MLTCGHEMGNGHQHFRIPHPLRGVSQGVRETIASNVEALGVNGVRLVRTTASLHLCGACAAKEATNVVSIVGRRPRVIEVIPSAPVLPKRTAAAWIKPAHLRTAARMPRGWRVRQFFRRLARRVAEFVRLLPSRLPVRAA